MNNINLVGRLGKDPEIRTTSTGKMFATFSIAVPKRIKPTDGSPDADWFNVKVWGQTANYVQGYIVKGSLVSVSGRMESRKYEKDGQTREIWEVAADQVNGLNKQTDGGQPSPRTTVPPVESSYDPFGDDD